MRRLTHIGLPAFAGLLGTGAICGVDMPDIELPVSGPTIYTRQ